MTSLLASLSQIYLVASWRAGLVIALALALVSPALAAGALGGAALGIGCFLVFSRVRRRWGGAAPSVTLIDAQLSPQARAGLLGYNGALIGALVMSRCGWSVAALGWSLLGVLGGVSVHALLERSLGRFPGNLGSGNAALPVLTAPFCLVGTALVVLLPPQAGTPVPCVAPGCAFLGIPAAFAQVSLGSGWLAGLLILAALASAAPRAAAWGVGAAVLTLPVLFLIPVADFAGGAWSYCAALVGIALGATFAGEPDEGAGGWRHRVIPVIAAVAFALLIQAAFLWAGWPVLTWPFVLSTWVALAVEGLRYGR